jgi:hypothetical protein
VKRGTKTVGDPDLFQHFERSRVHHGGARGVGTLGETIDENEGDPSGGEHAAEGESGGARSHDHHIGLGG